MLAYHKCGRENPDGFRFCGFCGASLAPEAGEIRKTVTVLFSDVTGSTSLGERPDSESLRSVMSRYFDVARTVLERHGGTVEKSIGDAVMAVFGVPEVHEDDALRTARAAVELRESVSALIEELERSWGARLQIRTGVNSGDVVAGDPPAGQAFVFGDAVNVAARLEQAARPGEILIGTQTLGLARDAVRVDPVETFLVALDGDPAATSTLLEAGGVAASGRWERPRAPGTGARHARLPRRDGGWTRRWLPLRCADRLLDGRAHLPADLLRGTLPAHLRASQETAEDRAT